MMKCYYHPDVEAVNTCMNCGKALCHICSVDVTGKIICQQCLSSGNVSRYTVQPVTPIQPTKPYNILAIVSISLGVIGIIGSVFFSIPAWITGYLARKQITENPNQDGMPLATAGMWLGIIVTALYVIGFLCFIAFTLVAFVLSRSS
jgi:hypothetical protein